MPRPSAPGRVPAITASPSRAVESEGARHVLGGDRAVHRADQRQPAAGRGAERRPPAPWIDQRTVGIGKQRAGCAEAQGEHARRHVAGADRSHHVVAAADRNTHARRTGPVPRQLSARAENSLLAATSGGRQAARSRSGSVAASICMRPAPRAHIQPAGAGCIATLHPALAGEPEIHVVVRQQDGRQPCVDVRPVLARPGQLGCGVAGQDRVACQLDASRRAADCGHDLSTFGLGAGIAPQLRRRKHLACRIQRNEAMLLARYADGGDAGAKRRIQTGEAGADGRNPPLGPLFPAAVPARDQLKRRTLLSQRPGAGRRRGQGASRSGCPHPARQQGS